MEIYLKQEPKGSKMKKYRIKFKVEQIYDLDVEAANEDAAYDICIEERQDGNLDEDKEMPEESYALESIEEIK